MKIKRLTVALLSLLLLSGILMTVAFADVFPSVPDATVTLTQIPHDNLFGGLSAHDTWYIDNVLSGVPTGFDVKDGMYTPAWCVDRDGMSLAISGVQVYMFSSLALPSEEVYPLLYILDWNKVNYILNHIPEGATTADIQQAIWALLPPVATDPPRTEISNGMVSAANSLGAAFVPGQGQVVAVICYPVGAPENDLQITIITLEIPTEQPDPPSDPTLQLGLSPGFWKYNIDVALHGQGLFSSPHEGESPLTALDLQGWAAEIPITLEEAYAVLNSRGPRNADARLSIANAFNTAAGFTEYVDEDQTQRVLAR